MNRISPRRMILIILVQLILMGCGLEPELSQNTVDKCYRETSLRIQQKPPLDCLETLDDRCVPLQPFYDMCNAHWPDCVLFQKFYYWDSQVMEVVSQSPSGPVPHKIRAYFNLASTCNPEFNDPGRIHGDVAEFYDEQDRFMGLAVYMGQGLYVPLPFQE